MAGYNRLGPHGQGQQSDEQNPFQDPYNHRSPSPYHDSLYRPPTMSPVHHPHDPYQAHSPSPGPHGQDVYAPNNGYIGQRPLDIPMGPGPSPGPHGRATPSDRLASQPTYAVDNVQHSYSHNGSFAPPATQQQHYGQPQHQGGYALDPEAHHDAYYNQPYQPSPGEELGQYPVGNGQYYHDEGDTRPILAADHSYGPDPYQTVPDDYEETVGGGPMEYMDAEGNSAPPPPPAPVRRWKTVKEVQLFQGNLVLDCPVPPRLLNQMDRDKTSDRDEYTHMRYSAATCDPNEFYADRFTLRQRLFAKPRHTELFIVITMYNEEDELFARTLNGVIKNIEHMNTRTNSKTWGKDAWKKIVVCIVSDGRAQINPRTRAVLAGLGVYQDGIAKQQVNGKPVTAHIYEYTTQMTVDIKNHVVQIKKGSSPVQMLFCLKEKNQKKINSHRWFFQAFGSVLDPNICVLLDAGTKPGKDSIYMLWKKFEKEPSCAGACGEIKAMLGTGLLNPLVAAQNFEYKISNILDKPLESVFGFISVLPGAFSAYRYIALQNDKTGQGPLEKYFKGETLHGDVNAGVFSSNMYLAEDRILCFELVAKRNCHWILQYVKGATGETDVPTEIDDFIKQRRRWLNGSFFAAVYAVVHFYQIFRSGHSFLRKMMFLVEFLYQTLNMLFAWFAIGNFFLVFYILTHALSHSDLLGNAGLILSVVFEWLYLITLFACFVLALGNTPTGSKKFYLTMVYFWAVIMVYLMFAAVFITVKSIQTQVAKGAGNLTFADVAKDPLFYTLFISMVSTYILYFVMSILFLDPWHMVTSFLQYILLTPTYINVLNVYAFCNTHDVTWGTKGADKPDKLPSVTIKPGGAADVTIPDNENDLNSQYEAELRAFSAKEKKEKRVVSASDKQENYYKGFRSAVVLIWIFCNLGLTAIVLNTGGFQSIVPKNNADTDTQTQDIVDYRATIYMGVVLWSVAGLSAFRWVGGLWFLILRLFKGV